MSPGSSGGKRWFIYALGGGVGHLTRAIALARVARGLGHGIRVLTNSPFAASLPIEQDLGEEAALIRIDPTLDRDTVASNVRSMLEPCDFDVLIVNTFPRGLAGELATFLGDLTCPKVLIHRDLNPAYVRWAGLRSFATRYDLIILPGEDAPLGDLPSAIRTDAWLLRDRAELLDRTAARRRLGITCDDERPVVVVAGCGRWDEIEAARLVAVRMHEHVKGVALVRFVSVKGLAVSERYAGSFIWPLLEVMAGIDVLVGSGGYNTVHEARATETPLVALAQNRKYDRQDVRLSPAERAVDEADVIDRVVKHFDSRSASSRTVPSYPNGVHAAVEAIERLIHRGC